MDVIHLILGKANPARMNGVNRVVHELATRQQQAGYAVEVWGFTANPVDDYPPRHYVTRLFRAARQPFAVDSAWKQAMLERRTDVVVHIHGGFVPRFYSAAQFLKKHQIPYLLTPHGAYNTLALRRSWLRKQLYFRIFERRVLRGAGAIHALGQSEVQGAQRLFPNTKSRLIPYGYEASADANATSQTGFIVGFCGRIDVFTKGLDQLLPAFAQFRQHRPDAQLWLIGDGPERPALEKQAQQLGLAESATFWGSKFGEEKLALLRQCTVFAHPSRNEGLPTAVLEAAALGLPCLISEATNLGDAVRQFDAGYVTPDVTAAQLAEGLVTLHERIGRGEGATLRQNAHRMVAEGFDWAQVLGRFHQLYQQVWQPN